MYLFDANVFITAARLYYAFDLAPGFWEWLAAQGDAGNIGSIPRVKAELTGSTDPLSEWAKARPDWFWIAESADTLASAGFLTAWIMSDVEPELEAQGLHPGCVPCPSGPARRPVAGAPGTRSPTGVTRSIPPVLPHGAGRLRQD